MGGPRGEVPVVQVLFLRNNPWVRWGLPRALDQGLWLIWVILWHLTVSR
jgi:hypothetical protein